MNTCPRPLPSLNLFHLCSLIILGLLISDSARAQTINVTAGGTETINVDTTIDDINFAGDGTIDGTGNLIGAGSSIAIDVTGAANTGTIETSILDSVSAATDTTLQINGDGGTGAVVLNSASVYVGGTVLNAGSLTAGDDRALGTGAVTAVDGTAIIFELGPNESITNDFNISGTVGMDSGGRGVTLIGNVGGTGGILKTGTRGVTFQGNNTFTGGIQVQQGFIVLDTPTAAGTGTVIVEDSTAVGFGSTTIGNNIHITGNTNLFQSGGNATLNGVISGTGSFDKGGDGIMNLTNSHTFTGSLDILAGTINLNGTGSLMTDTITGSSFTIVNLRTDGGALLNTPSISFETQGSLDHTFSITGDETIGALSATMGTGSGMVITEVDGITTTLTFGDATTTSFDGLIRGTGNLVKQGTGTFSLIQASTLSGTVTVNEGIFDLMGDGALASTTIDLNGGELQTDGGGLAAGANVSVGNGGTFDVNGDETINQVTNLGTVDIAAGQTLTANTLMQNGGLFLVNGNFSGDTTINGGRLGGDGTLTGAVTINPGGTVAPGNSIGTTTVIGNVTFNPGSTYEVEVNANGTSDLIQATGTATINGGTVSILPEPGNYADQATYTILTAAGGVTGTFDASTIDNNFAFLSPVLRTDPNTVFLDLLRNTNSFSSVARTFNQRQVSQALDGDQANATGELQTVIDNIIVQSADEARQSFDNLSGEIHAAGINANFLALQTAVGTIRDRGKTLPTYPVTPVDGKSVISSGKAKALVIDDSRAPAGWIQAYGTWGEIDHDGNGSEIDHHSGGVLLGLEYGTPDHSVFGFSLGSLSTRADIPHQEFEADGIIGAITVVHHTASGFIFNLAGGFAYQDIETERRLSVGTFSANAEANYDAVTAFVSGKTYLEHHFDGALFQPFLGVDAIFTETDGFRETGAGTAGLTSNGDSYSSVVGRIGVDFAGQSTTRNGRTVAHSLSLAYAREFGDTTPEASLAFVGGSTGFVSRSAARGEDRLEVKATLATELNDHTVLLGTVETILTDADAAVAGTVQMQIAF